LAAATNQSGALSGVIPGAADSAARRAMLASVGFGVFGALTAVLMLTKVSVPGLFEAAPIAGYGRLRALTFNSLVYGFGGLAATGLAYYITPRLTGTPLARERIAHLAAAIHTAAVTAGLFSIFMGWGNGSELAEFPLIIDIVMVVALAVPALLVTATIRSRTERTLYVSLWYMLAAVWWLPTLYLIGAMPGTTGIGTQLQSAFSVGGLIGAWLPLVGTGAAYYVIPRASGRPLYSRSLAQAGFWTLIGTGLFASVTRYGSGAAPGWLETTGTIFSLGLGVAAIATVVNLAATLQGSYQEIQGSVPMRMISAGLLINLGTAVFLSVQGFRSVEAIIGLTSWYEGLALATLLGSAPLLLVGAMAYALPQISGRRLVTPLADRGITATAWGGSLTGVMLVVSGVITGLGWNSGAVPNAGADYVRTTALTSTYQLIALLTAMIAAVGIAHLALVVVQTFTSGDAIPTEVLVEVEAEHE
jgi:cytochrome c oxidase cbb3-type subunit 1